MIIAFKCPMCREQHRIRLTPRLLAFNEDEVVCSRTGICFPLKLELKFPVPTSFPKQDLAIAEEIARKEELKWYREEVTYHVKETSEMQKQ